MFKTKQLTKLLVNNKKNLQVLKLLHIGRNAYFYKIKNKQRNS